MLKQSHEVSLNTSLMTFSSSGSRIDTGSQDQEPQDICGWSSLVTVCNLNGVRSLCR